MNQLVIFLQFLKRKVKEEENSIEDEKAAGGNEKGLAIEERDKSAVNVESKNEGIIVKKKPSNLSWLKERSWHYVLHFEEEFTDLRGMFVSFYFPLKMDD